MILTTRHAQTVDGLKPLLGPWAQLRDEHGRRVPNNDPGLFDATVRAMPDTTPDVTLFLDGATPRALIVARRCRRRVVRGTPTMMRCLDVVYGGLITDGTTHAQSAVLGNLVARLQRHTVDHVMINHLPVDDELAAPLVARHGLAGRPGPRSLHRRFTLVAGSAARTFERFSKKHRYNLRRADRQFVAHFAGDVHMHVINRPADMAAFIDDAVRIHAEAWQGRAGFGSPPVQRARLEHAATRGLARCYRLVAGGRAVAHQTGLVLEGTYHLLSTAYVASLREHSPGHVLLARVIGDLADEGIAEIDYGFGDAPYKQQYSTHVHEERTIRLYAPTVAGQRARALHGLTGAARHLAVRTGVAARLGRLRRRRRLAGI